LIEDMHDAVTVSTSLSGMQNQPLKLLSVRAIPGMG
jgi:hypothetical protein